MQEVAAQEVAARSSDSESEDRHDAVHRLVFPSDLEGVKGKVKAEG